MSNKIRISTKNTVFRRSCGMVQNLEMKSVFSVLLPWSDRPFRVFSLVTANDFKWCPQLISAHVMDDVSGHVTCITATPVVRQTRTDWWSAAVRASLICSWLFSVFTNQIIYYSGHIVRCERGVKTTSNGVLKC